MDVKASDGKYTLTQTGAEVQADLDFAEDVATAIAEATAGQALVSDGDGGVSVTDMPDSGITQQQADERYLQLSGGDLTGDVSFPSSKGVKLDVSGTKYNLIQYSGGNLEVGNNILNNAIIETGSAGNIYKKMSGNTYRVFDSSNTEANPTLDGTESDLTGLKLGGVKYKVPSGGGGSGHLYWHSINMINGNVTSPGVNYNLYIIYLSTSSAELTKDDFMAIVNANQSADFLAVVGVTSNSSYFPVKIKYYNSTTFSVFYTSGSTSPNSFTQLWSNTDIYFKDTVNQIF